LHWQNISFEITNLNLEIFLFSLVKWVIYVPNNHLPKPCNLFNINLKFKFIIYKKNLELKFLPKSIITNFCYVTTLIVGLLPKLWYEKESGLTKCAKTQTYSHKCEKLQASESLQFKKEFHSMSWSFVSVLNFLNKNAN